MEIEQDTLTVLGSPFASFTLVEVLLASSSIFTLFSTLKSMISTHTKDFCEKMTVIFTKIGKTKT